MRIDEFGAAAVYVDIEFGEHITVGYAAPEAVYLPVKTTSWLLLDARTVQELILSAVATYEVILDVRN